MGEAAELAVPQAPASPEIPRASVSTKASVAPVVVVIGSALLIVGALWWTFGTGTRPAAVPHVADTAPATQTPAVAIPATARTALVGEVSAATLVHPVLDEQQIRDALENWRLDWSRRDVDAYLKHYSPSFMPASGQARAEWEATRRKSISSRPAIRVEVNDLRIEPQDAQQVRLSFLQNYISGTYKSRTAQTARLVLGTRAGRSWVNRQGRSPSRRPKTLNRSSGFHRNKPTDGEIR
jgi:hypothetical protein